MPNAMRSRATTLSYALLLTTLPALSAHADGILKVGDAMPSLTFEDINGVKASSGHYDTRIQVVTFADRGSSDQLMEWLLKAGPEVMTRHPSLKMAYLGFADLQSVPSIFEDIVYPALKIISKRSENTLAKAFEDQGVQFRADTVAYHLTPDWEGDYLTKFGLEDADSFHCFVVRDGTIVAHFDGETQDIGGRYISLMDELMKKPSPSKTPKLGAASL